MALSTVLLRGMCLPPLRLAQEMGCALTFEDSIANDFATDRLAVGLGHGSSRRIEVCSHLELVEGAVPIPTDGEQLKKKGSVLGLRRSRPDFVFQRLQGAVEVAPAKAIHG